MTSLVKIVRNLAIVLGFIAAGMATAAQAQNCGITGSATASPAVYDPFNPSGLASTTITMNLTRVNNSGGGDTRIVNFYLRANATTGTAADGSSIVPVSVAGSAAIEGLGLNIFHNYNGPFPNLPNTSGTINGTPTSGNRYLEINFTGNNAASNTAQVTFNVSLPANLNLNAVQSLAFDAWFTCNIQGGQANGQVSSGTFGNAVVFPVTVLSALRTYYAGTDLAFGEIGNIPPVPLAPVRTNPANYIFVQSSGAYSVTLSSQNAFKMKKPGAVAVGDEVRYSLKFLGDTRSTATTPTPGATAITHTCMRAGLAMAGQQLPIQATLIDGGQGKNPSPTYTDILTVTITPLAYATVSADNCGTYSVP